MLFLSSSDLREKLIFLTFFLKRVTQMRFTSADMIKNQWNNAMKTTPPLKTDICFYYHQAVSVFMMFNKDELYKQMKVWKQHLIKGDMYILKENCKTRHINGEEYHFLVVQGHYVHDFCKLGYLFDEGAFLVSGFIYMFKSKENRDNVFNWLNKYNQVILPPKGYRENCDICMDEDEHSMKTSCCNQNLCIKCVSEKRDNKCPFCRKEFK